MTQTKRVEPFWQDCGSTPGLFSSHQLHELATVAGVQRGLLSQQPLSLAGILQLISSKATQKQMQVLKAWSVILSTRSLNILSYFKVRLRNWKPLHYLISIVPPSLGYVQWSISMNNFNGKYWAHCLIEHLNLCVSIKMCIAGYCLFCMAVLSCWMSWYIKTLGTLCDLKGIGSCIMYHVAWNLQYAGAKCVTFTSKT